MGKCANGQSRIKRYFRFQELGKMTHSNYAIARFVNHLSAIDACKPAEFRLESPYPGDLA
jgi:hypothetical protein